MDQQPGVNSGRLKGKVVLVDFWTRECINCQHTLPYVRDWADIKYVPRGGPCGDWYVHTPEYPGECSFLSCARR